MTRKRSTLIGNRIKRKPQRLSALESTINGAFSKALLPVPELTEEMVVELLTKLGLDRDTPQCSYCRSALATDWDHLFGPTKGKRPTGHGHSRHNLVPVCGPCNQSKGARAFGDGNGDWLPRNWTSLPETSRKDIHARISQVMIAAAEEIYKLDELKTRDEYREYWSLAEKIEGLLSEADELAARLRAQIDVVVKS